MKTLPPLTCKSCNGTGIWDAGTEDESKCGRDYCHEGVLVCATCFDHSGGDEPAAGEWTGWNSYLGRDYVVPLCGLHLKRANHADDEECRGDFLRDMQKDGGI